MFLCTFTCLLLTEVGGAKAFNYMSDIFFFSLSGRASPYGDGRMSSVILRPPWWFIEDVHGCMTCSLISETINEWLEIKWRIKARARSERTVESRKLSFSISEKTLKVFPLIHPDKAAEAQSTSLSLFLSFLFWISRVLQWWSNSMGS